MRTRVSYPIEVKMKAIEMRLNGVPVKKVMEELNICNRTQLKVWMKWYREEQIYRLKQPVGKQYSFGKGPEFLSETEKLQAEIRLLKQQLDVLKVQRVGKDVEREVAITFIKQHRELSVKLVCSMLNISKAT